MLQWFVMTSYRLHKNIRSFPLYMVAFLDSSKTRVKLRICYNMHVKTHKEMSF